MSSNKSPFSIRSIKAPDDRKLKTVAEFIARVNATHPGGFRALNAADAKTRIEEQRQKQQDAGLDDSDIPMEDSAGAEEENNAEATKDLAAARMDILRNISIAWSQANNALQMVSLLMSKEAPTQVMDTLDPELRNIVGIGSLGSTKLHEPPFLEERLPDSKVVSSGARLQAINSSTNKVLAAATRLQKEMTLEAEYWQQVLSIKRAGWPVSRLPNNPLNVAVRFGFSDSSLDFQANSWAALDREDDGSVNMKMPRLVREPKQLVVSVEKNGKVVGRSSVAQPLPSDAPLDLRVREARNTILAQELWHEINREGHTLLSYEVQLLSSSVRYQADETTAISLTLTTLGDASELEGEQHSEADDGYAETICAALHLLLAYTHRQNARKRAQIQPLSKDKSRQAKPAYPLLKPLVAFMKHEHWIRKNVEFVSDLTAILRRAGIASARFELEEVPVHPVSADNASENLLNAVLGSPFTFRIHLTLTPQVRMVLLGVTGGTFLRPSSVVRVMPPQPRRQQDPQAAAQTPSLLAEVYPPADVYDDLKEFFEYLQGATTRALAKHFEILAAEWMASVPGESSDNPAPSWATSLKGDAVRDVDTERRGVSFELLGDNEAGLTTSQRKGHLSARSLPKVTGLKLLGDQLNTQGGISTQSWIWTVDSAPGQAERIEDVVQRVLMTAA